MQSNLIKDLSTLSTIKEKDLVKLLNKAVYCINDSLEETTLAGNNVLIEDIGLGSLYISIENNEIKYKFIPSKDFESSILKTVVSKKNPLSDKLEDTLVKRISNAYKDLLWAMS